MQVNASVRNHNVCYIHNRGQIISMQKYEPQINIVTF